MLAKNTKGTLYIIAYILNCALGFKLRLTQIDNKKGKFERKVGEFQTMHLHHAKYK